MRIPHHLHRARSGRWHFRRRVPADLIPILRRKFIKKSLGTSQVVLAQVRAIAVNAQCLSIFTALRARHMPPKSKKAPPDPGESLNRFDWTIRLPDGLLISAEGADDHTRVMEAMQALPALLGSRPTGAAVTSAAPAKVIKAGDAARDWVVSLTHTTLVKIRSQMKAAVESFVQDRRDVPLSEIRRPDIAEWIQVLANSGLAPNTINSKMSFLARFFDWATNAGYYAGEDNPARGQFKYSKKQKKLRQQYSWRALSREEVQILYAPSHLTTLSPAKRWAALLGLYTGARVSEIAQLAVADVANMDQCLCLRIRAEARGQSLKTSSSERVIPVHPDLLTLGFYAYVEALRESGEVWLFPTSKVDTVNGRGNSFSTAFTRHVKRYLPPAQSERRVGFHSLRKTVTERMQDAKVLRNFGCVLGS